MRSGAVFRIAMLVCCFGAMARQSTGEPMDESHAGYTAEQFFNNQQVAILARVACDGDVDAVERAVKNGADPNSRGLHGYTPIFWVLTCQNTSGVAALLKAGANPNYAPPPREENSTGGLSAVIIASRNKNPAFLKLILEHGGDPNAAYGTVSALSTALDVGLLWGVWDNYNLLLASGVDINRENGGQTIAERAAMSLQYDKVADLLKRGYNQNLSKLGSYSQHSAGDIDREQETWRLTVIELLKKKGVKFPVLPGYVKFKSGLLTMSQDGTLVMRWYTTHGGTTALAFTSQTLRPADSLYRELQNRVGGMRPGETKVVSRAPSDPTL
jgi:uncharacterized protein